jgi:hypothetical protein
VGVCFAEAVFRVGVGCVVWVLPSWWGFGFQGVGGADGGVEEWVGGFLRQAAPPESPSASPTLSAPTQDATPTVDATPDSTPNSATLGAPSTSAVPAAKLTATPIVTAKLKMAVWQLR